MKKEKAWYKKISNWIVIIGCLILIPILAINIWIMIQSKTNKDEVPSVFGYKPFMVLSGSMESEIFKGDLILTKIVDPKTLKVDDVIAFRDAYDTVTTHRIIDIVEKDGKDYFITKGDNNNTQDLNLVGLDDIEGIYVMRIPGIGSMMRALSEPTTILILVFGITMLFVLGFMISTKKQAKLEREEYLEYKRQKELEQQSKTKTEYDEFLEFKKMKELHEKQNSEGDDADKKEVQENSKD